MIKSFSVSNFRNLNVQDLEFGKINLFIGPNNSGKSNFFDALGMMGRLFAEGREGNKSTFLNEMEKAGWNDLLRRDLKKPGEIDMKWKINPNKSTLTYNLKYRIGEATQIPKGFYLTKESLFFDGSYKTMSVQCDLFDLHGEESGRGNISKPELVGTSEEIAIKSTVVDNINSQDIFFNQMQRIMAESEEFRMNYYPSIYPVYKALDDYFSKYRTYSSNAFNLDEARFGSDFDLSEVYLERSGGNFANVLANLDGSHFYLDDLTKRLQQLMPSLENIKVVHLNEKKRQIRLKINGKIFTLNEMSDGTIKAMMLALLLSSPEPLKLLMVDEPELNLHPAWLRVIANWMVLSNSAEQIFINTHSPDFLDMFTESYRAGRVSLFVFSLDSEKTVQRVPPEKLDELLNEGWEIGDLYRVGDPNLGGWPW